MSQIPKDPRSTRIQNIYQQLKPLLEQTDQQLMSKFADRIRNQKQNLYNRYRLCIQKSSAQECYQHENQRMLKIKMDGPKVELYNCINHEFVKDESNTKRCVDLFKGKVQKLIEEELNRVGQ